MNNWLLSCRWMCPSAGASCVAAGNSSTRSDASFTFRSARTLCHRLSFSGTLVSTRTSSGPFPTSKEKTTSEEAGEERWWSEQLDQIRVMVVHTEAFGWLGDCHTSRVSLTCFCWLLTGWLTNLPWHFEIIVSSHEWDIANPLCRFQMRRSSIFAHREKHFKQSITTLCVMMLTLLKLQYDE